MAERSKSKKKKNVDDLLAAGRVPPQAVDVERYILGALLLDKEAVAVAIEQIDETDINRGDHFISSI